MEIKKRAFYLFAVDVVLFSVWIITNDTLVLGLATSISLIILYEAITSHMSLSNVELNRTSSSNRHTVGDLFKENFDVQNNSKFMKNFIEVIDNSDLGSGINSRVVAQIPPGASRRYGTTVTLNKRGIYPLGPTILKTESLLGLFSKKVKIQPSKKILVYPKIVEVGKTKIRDSFRLGSGNLWTYSTQTTPQVASIREYQPGDPLHRVHWPITLKHDALMVKEFDEDSQAQTWIILDSQSGIHVHAEGVAISKEYAFQSQKKMSGKYLLPKDSFEYALTIAASVADYFISYDIPVGFTTVGDRVVNLQAEESQRQMVKILEELSTIADQGDLGIDTVFRNISNQIPKGSLAIMITNDDKAKISRIEQIALLKKIQLVAVRINSNSFRNEPALGDEKKTPIDIKQNLDMISFGDNLQERIERLLQ